MGDQVHDRSLLGELYMYIFFQWVSLGKVKDILSKKTPMIMFGSGEGCSIPRDPQYHVLKVLDYYH